MGTTLTTFTSLSVGLVIKFDLWSSEYDWRRLNYAEKKTDRNQPAKFRGYTAQTEKSDLNNYYYWTLGETIMGNGRSFLILTQETTDPFTKMTMFMIKN